MNYTDIINGGFEFLGFLFTIPSILNLYKHKEVKGVSWFTLSFFTFWSCWNVYFYTANKLSFSFIGGLFLLIVNIIWFLMVLYYSRKNKH